MTKFCVICGKTLTGRQTKLCFDRECHREWNKKRSREWYQNNHERANMRDREYYRNNREKTLERKREYYRNNREKTLERKREYYQNNSEKIKEYQHEYRQNNAEKTKESICEWRQNNAEKIKKNKCKDYRRSRGIPEDWDLTKESSIEVIMKRWLQESDIEFVEQHYVSLEGINYTKIDFFIEPNICLYCDGDYWHGPERPDIQERDAEQNRILTSMGYSVIRLSESDILAGVRPVEILELMQ